MPKTTQNAIVSHLRTLKEKEDLEAQMQLSAETTFSKKIVQEEVLNTLKSNIQLDNVNNLSIEQIRGVFIDTSSNLKIGPAEIGLGNVENKSAESILNEISKNHIVNTGLEPSDIGAETPAGAQSKVNARLTASQKSSILSQLSNLNSRINNLETATPLPGRE